MITITVQGHLTFREPVGKRQISLPAGSSLREVLAFMRQDLGGRFVEEAFDQAGELRQHVAVLLNGVHYGHLQYGLSTVLKDGDQIAIFPPIVGG
jgi:molybdopterin converting factor small subunit